MQLDGLQQVRSNRVEENPNTDIMIAQALIKAIERSTKAVIDNIPSVVAVSNLDEITASLRNELARANKPLITAINDLQKSNERHTILLIKSINPSAKVEIPDNIEISNIKEITYQLKKIAKLIKDMPKVDMGAIEGHLKLSMKKLRDNNKSNPIFVREVD